MSTLRVNAITNQAGTTQPAIDGTAKAWVNFDGTQAAASMIRASFNVSSITDLGTGLYNVNFATALVDANYSAVGTVSVKGSGNSARHNVTLGDPDGTYGSYTTTAINFRCDNAQSYAASDPLVMSAAVFR